MSISVTKGEGVTVLTMTSDPGSSCPLLCQLLRTLCCSPACAVSKGIRMVIPNVQSALATTQFMTGLFTIALGAILLGLNDGPYFMGDTDATYWFGAIFIVSGIFSVLAERYPSPCLVTLTVIVNLITAIVAMTTIGLYLVNDGWELSRMCEPRESSYEWSYDDYGDRHHVNLTGAEAMERNRVMENNLQICRMYKRLLPPMMMGLKVLLVVFAVLQLCVTISVAALGITALTKRKKQKQVSQVQQPLMEETAANPMA